MEKLYIKEKLENLVPYEFNNKKQIDLIINSIKENEYINPIIIDENNIILSGHGRLEALKQLGYKETEVIKVEGLTENQKKKYRILDNRLADLAEYDLENLKIDLEELGDKNLDELFEEFREIDIDFDSIKSNEDRETKEKIQNITCPECGHNFSI